jgi:hypothetical protein
MATRAVFTPTRASTRQAPQVFAKMCLASTRTRASTSTRRSRVWRVLAKLFGECWQVHAKLFGECRQVWRVNEQT